MSQPPHWTLFAGFLVLAVAFLLVTARASHRWLFGEIDVNVDSEGFNATGHSRPAPIDQAPDPTEPTHEEAVADEAREPNTPPTPADRLSTEALLLNVTLSQLLLGLALVSAVWLTGVPIESFGRSGALRSAIPTGIGLGILLYVLTELGTVVAMQFGYEADNRLRELLTPDDIRGWIGLFVIVLPSISVVEELLFRGALIGALSVGFGFSPWLLAVGSSVLFGVGHGAQGRGGVLVTGALGLLIAAGYIVTGSLLVVIVAHYCVNALEFVIHEGVGWDRTGARPP